MTLEQLKSVMTNQERTLVTLRYMTGTQSEIVYRLSISQIPVCGLLRKGLKKTRELIKQPIGGSPQETINASHSGH